MTTGISQLSNGLSGSVQTKTTLESNRSQQNSLGNPTASVKPPAEPAPETSAPESNDQPISRAQAEQLLVKMNLAMEQIQKGLSFTVDEDQGKVVIKVIDQETKETIRQIPSEEMVRISNRLAEVNSLLFDDISV